MKRFAFLIIVAAVVLLSLFVTLPALPAPATASVVAPRSTATVEVTRPTAPATVAVTAVVVLPTPTHVPATVQPTQAPTVEPPIVVKPVEPPAQPPAQQTPKADASAEQLRYARIERRLTQHNIYVKIVTYGVYCASDGAGSLIDLTPEQRLLVSEYTANGW